MGSFGAMKCEARTIPERLFMVAAEAVANCLDDHDLEVESVVPHPSRIRHVAVSVATAVALEAQKSGYAKRKLGDDESAVRNVIEGDMWNPQPKHRTNKRQKLSRCDTDFGMGQR